MLVYKKSKPLNLVRLLAESNYIDKSIIYDIPIHLKQYFMHEIVSFCYFRNICFKIEKQTPDEKSSHGGTRPTTSLFLVMIRYSSPSPLNFVCYAPWADFLQRLCLTKTSSNLLKILQRTQQQCVMRSIIQISIQCRNLTIGLYLIV